MIAWGTDLGYLVIGLCVARLSSVRAYRKTVLHGDESGFWCLMTAFVLFWPLIAPVFGTYVLGKGVARFIKGPVVAEKSKLNQMVADRDAWRARLRDKDDPMNEAAQELVTVLTDQILAKRRKLGVR